MSRWLQNVGQFLEKLDDQAERVVDERLLDVSGRNEDEQNIQDILASRGLHGTDSKDEDGTEGEQEEEDVLVEPSSGVHEDGAVLENSVAKARSVASDAAVDEVPAVQVEEQHTSQETPPVGTGSNEEGSASLDPTLNEESAESEKATEQVSAAKQDSEGVDAPPDKSETPSEQLDSEKEGGGSENKEAQTATEQVLTAEEKDDSTAKSVEAPPSSQASITSLGWPGVESASQEPSEPVRESPKVTQKEVARAAPPVPKPPPPPPQPDPRLKQQLRDTQKEARTLKKHVVSLNSQLENAEAEVHAQRRELEQAAERLENDRIKFKKERETTKSKHAAEVDQLKKKYEQERAEAKRVADSQLEEVRKQLRDLDEKRVQEGGDWNKELEQAILRERETSQKLAELEEEKSTFLAQISTLQSQQDSLGSHLESLTQTADNAMAREREADERLDETLTLHARQIALRNAREAELEKTVADLGAALVAARGKGESGSVDQTPGDSTFQSSHSSTLQQGLESEIEAIRNQLAHERQRNDALRRELKEMTKERTDEASVVTSRQLQFDRKVAEMSQEISVLKRELQEAKESNSFRGSFAGSVDSANEVKDLSEEVVRQRDTIANYSSEVSALKSRLRVSISRAEQAEAAAAEAAAAIRGSDPLHDVERGPGGKMRRRGRTKNSGDGMRGSMKEALSLDSFQGEGTKRLGNSLDALDSFLAKSWAILRYHPVARLVFILYLLLLHIWTFVLLFFHAHGFDSVQGDIGRGGMVPHGPNALLRSEVQHLPAPGGSGTTGN